MKFGFFLGVAATLFARQLHPQELFLDLPSTQNRQQIQSYKLDTSNEPFRLRHRFVTLDLPAINQKKSKKPTPLKFNLFQDLNFDGVMDSTIFRSPADFTWFGRIADEIHSQIVLVFNHGELTGNIRTAGKLYEVRPLDDEVHVVSEIGLADLDFSCVIFPHTDRNPGSIHEQPAVSVPDRISEDLNFIDVMIVLTQSAAEARRGYRTDAQLAIDETNVTYANSGIRQRLRLAHVMTISYLETGNVHVDLPRLMDTADGFLDEVHMLRDLYAADIVSLWTSTLNAGGGACTLTNPSNALESCAFNVVRQSGAIANFTFAHELGHNMGGHHDHPVTRSGAFPYSHGYNFRPEGWYTIMATGSVSSSRIPFWSNPDMNHPETGTAMGIPEGDSLAADNVRTFNNTASIVAGFRDLNIMHDSPPAAPLNLEAIAQFKKVTLTWLPNVEPDLFKYAIYSGTSPNPTLLTHWQADLSRPELLIRNLSNQTEYYFRITALDSMLNESDFSNEVSVIPQVILPDIPSSYELAQNYPNPFNPTTTIAFGLPQSNFVRLSVYDLLGKKVTTLVAEHKEPGDYSVTFDAKEQPSGLYFYKFEAGFFTAIKKMMVLK